MEGFLYVLVTSRNIHFLSVYIDMAAVMDKLLSVPTSGCMV